LSAPATIAAEPPMAALALVPQQVEQASHPVQAAFTHSSHGAGQQADFTALTGIVCDAKHGATPVDASVLAAQHGEVSSQQGEVFSQHAGAALVQAGQAGVASTELASGQFPHFFWKRSVWA
jgi:hypothetical protein